VDSCRELTYAAHVFRFLIITMLFGALAMTSRAQDAEVASPKPTARDVEAAIASIGGFLTEHMTDRATGAVYVNAINDRPVVAGEARNQDALSEAVGQVMELALLRGDRRMFEQQFALTRDKFQDKPGGFLAWKITLDPFKRADTSATLDDWRVVWACRLAAKRWGLPEVDKFGRLLAAELAAKATGYFIPPPAFNLGDGSPGKGAVLLCYLHLPAMLAFADEIPAIRAFYDHSLEVLDSIPLPPGVVPAKWDPVTRKFSSGVSDEVLALITLRYLQEVRPGAPLVKAGVESRLRFFREHGRLPQAFDTKTGAGVGEPAGAAVYALWARLLVDVGQPEEAGPAIGKMLEFQNGPDAKFTGAIGGYPVFSFDQLEALLALESYRAAVSAGARSGSR
jgi:hypothetical protein